MGVSLDLILDDGVEFQHLDALAQLVRAAGASEPVAPAGDWELAVRLCSDAEIANLHATYFADPTPTDVITFPSGEPRFSDGGHLGDIVISVDTAARQAGEAGHSRDREIAYLTLHGVLHLAGWNDATEGQRTAMLARQDELLATFERQQRVPW